MLVFIAAGIPVSAYIPARCMVNVHKQNTIAAAQKLQKPDRSFSFLPVKFLFPDVALNMPLQHLPSGNHCNILCVEEWRQKSPM